MWVVASFSSQIHPILGGATWKLKGSAALQITQLTFQDLLESLICRVRPILASGQKYTADLCNKM